MSRTWFTIIAEIWIVGCRHFGDIPVAGDIRHRVPGTYTSSLSGVWWGRYDVERTIVREIDAEGAIISEEIVHEALIECHCDIDLKEIGGEMNSEEEEIIGEKAEDDE